MSFMSFTARIGAWAPSPGPWDASLGGGPDPMCESQTVSSPLAFRVKTDDDFDVDSKSFWGRSWIPLGGRFGSSWRLFPSKLVPEQSWNRLIFEKVIPVQILCFPMLFHEFYLHMAPQNEQRLLQDESWIVLDCLFVLLGVRFDF